MRIGIDARFVLRPRRGIGNYSLELIRSLARIDKNNRYVLYVDRADVNGELAVGENFQLRLLKPGLYALWENGALALAAVRDRIDILHCLGNTAPVYLPRPPALLVTLHDVMFFGSGTFVPKPRTWYQRFGWFYRRLNAKVRLRKADHYLTDSEHSKNDILSAIPTIRAADVTVIYPGIAQRAPSPAPRMPEQPYVLCLGAEDARKNTAAIVRTYLRLREKGTFAPRLLITGYPNFWESDEGRFAKASRHSADIVSVGFVPALELAALYRGALFLAYPSLYEGFGFPILEAMSFDCPVITSTSSSLPELAGDAAILIDPQDEGALAKAMEALARDEALRTSLRLKGRERVRAFAWENTARQTLAVYARFA